MGNTPYVNGKSPIGFSISVLVTGVMTVKIKKNETWPTWKKKLADTLTEKQLSMKEASLLAGLGETFVRDTIKRDSEPSRRNLEKLSVALGVDFLSSANSIEPNTVHIPIHGLRVIGTIAAGSFMDINIFNDIDEPDFETIPIGPDARYEPASQYALAVSGDSMDRLFPDGSFVTCANWEETGLAPRAGMVVHIERRRAGLVETTVKRLAARNNEMVLAPESTNAAHKPISFTGDETDEIVIRGLVTGSWTPISY